MSSAEELSRNRYPTLAEKYAFIDGYEQAEKDLELTWEDIKLLDKIFMDEKIMSGLILGKKEYEEILKRFKENR